MRRAAMIRREKELERAVGELQERLQEQDEQILEFLYQKGELERPPKEMTLSQYLAELEQGSNFNEEVIIRDVSISKPRYSREVLKLFAAYHVKVFDPFDDSVQEFRVNPNDQKTLSKKLESLAGKVVTLIVKTNSGPYYFVNDIVEDNES